MRYSAADIMKDSPIPYVKELACETLFSTLLTPDTGFFVDHGEAPRALGNNAPWR